MREEMVKKQIKEKEIRNTIKEGTVTKYGRKRSVETAIQLSTIHEMTNFLFPPV
jgi:hypothetical protein